MRVFLICVQISAISAAFNWMKKCPVKEWMKPILEKNWFCGSGGRTEYLAQKVADFHQMPPSAKYAFNHCCAVHDDCYDQHLGKNFCDETFNACNWLITTHLVGANVISGHVWRLGAIVAVEWFGGNPYRDAGRTQVKPYIPTENKKIGVIYPLLFRNCPRQIATFSSCAVQFDLCASRNLTHCEVYLQNCLHVSRGQRDTINPNYSCDCAVRAVQLSIDVPIYTELRHDLGAWEVVRSYLPVFFYVFG